MLDPSQSPSSFNLLLKYLFSNCFLTSNADCLSINQSINQSINLYRAIVQRRVLQCSYAESKRNVLRRILNVLTDGAVRHFSGREFQSLGAATEKRRAAVSKLCGGTITFLACNTLADLVTLCLLFGRL